MRTFSLMSESQEKPYKSWNYSDKEALKVAENLIQRLDSDDHGNITERVYTS